MLTEILSMKKCLKPGLIVNLKINEKETVDRTKKSARIYYLNYLRHVNDNVGRPVLAVNSDAIIE